MRRYSADRAIRAARLYREGRVVDLGDEPRVTVESADRNMPGDPHPIVVGRGQRAQRRALERSLRKRVAESVKAGLRERDR